MPMYRLSFYEDFETVCLWKTVQLARIELPMFQMNSLRWPHSNGYACGNGDVDRVFNREQEKKLTVPGHRWLPA